MPESVQIAIGFLLLMVVFVLTRYMVAWQEKRATETVLRDLEAQAALDPFTAVELPYAKLNPLRIGMRNYHVKAVEYMVSEGVVGKTGNGRYYLRAHDALKAGKTVAPEE